MSKKSKKEEKANFPGEEGEGKKKGGIVSTIIGFVLITAIAGGLGFATSMFLLPTGDNGHMTAGKEDHPKKDQHKVEEEGHGEEKAEHGDDDEEEGGPTMFGHAKSIPAILTNLASPKTTWVRLEVALVSDGPLAEELPDLIHQDLLAFMRTVKLRHVQGPSGFLTLKAELNDRAAIRSEGKVKQVLIKTLLFE